MSKSRMQLTAETGTDFWNDSCDLEQLQEALDNGAVGATSNPVIVSAVVKGAPKLWNPVIDRIIRDHPTATEDEVAWELIAELGKAAAKLLLPEFEKSGGRRGRLSLQVNPKYFRNADAMLAQAVELSQLAPNLAIKMPVVTAGLQAMETATARGIVVTPTVSFTVAQAVAAAEAIERGRDRAQADGRDIRALWPNVTIMVGRLDDHLKRVMEAENLSVDPGCLEWAGVAVFKRAYQIFQQRGFRSRLLAAAYRNHLQWSEFVGGAVTVSIPHAWWKRFNASSIEVTPRIDVPVRAAVIKMLEDNFLDFRRAYEPAGLSPVEFAGFGSTVHTLKQFIHAYHELLAIIRDRMLR